MASARIAQASGDAAAIARIYSQGIGDLVSTLEAPLRSRRSVEWLAALPTNVPGQRLYERHSFQLVGTYHEQGMLDGRWLDVMMMEKLFS